ncbi:hypothetical protein [Marinobacter sp. CHS3-4]|uniref:hypothetical protein n=1 Tax=Marinobacter sp. CHS3-4 TaxID=3045174 RepID=UPI0024B5B872|nr:hypothetical protein [Marinobacter sp. CHS3-4]MDI9245265.1 hypothetical protein [Marinobacter sp. CHS3-4]
MRADSFFSHFGISGRLALFSLILLIFQGCKTERASEDPAIIGIPPEDAYLGVEYFYNFGAVDNDDILKYSLTNAPSWLAMEDTTNKARQGIIIRGVPGITGGERGLADLGKTTRINLVGNDGATLGAQPFSIEVQENQLTVVSQDYSEARPEEEENGEEGQEIPNFQCEKPFVSDRGENTYPTNVYDDAGNVIDTVDTTSETQPILVRVNLDQPSVTTVRVAFELSSGFDPARCDPGFSPEHQRCDAGTANADDAAIGRDIVALGTGSGPKLPVPEYLEYQQDENGRYTKGVLTLQPGITECFVRLEVVDDQEPEPEEFFNFGLTEVRSGLAGLGSRVGGVREVMSIEDNEPTVSFQTLARGKRDVMNLSPDFNFSAPSNDPATWADAWISQWSDEALINVRTYQAVMEGDRDQTYSVKIGSQKGADAIFDPYDLANSDYFVQVKNPDYPAPENEPEVPEWILGDELAFPVGTDTVQFRIVTKPADEYENNSGDDRVILLGPDSNYQAGRTGYARSDSAPPLRIGINELNMPIQIGAVGGFVPSDMAFMDDGRLIIAGYDSAANNIPQIRVFDKAGEQQLSQDLSATGVSPEAPPVIDFASREVEVGGVDVAKLELAVVFGIEEDAAGNPTPGDINLATQRRFYDTAAVPPGFTREWELINGTDQDDFPRWIGLSTTDGSIAVAGETSGTIETDDTFNGRLGSFVQRVDTEQDGSDLKPGLAWQRKAESVSHDERVVGGGAPGASPIVIGDSTGAVESQSQFGGKDAFFYEGQPKDEDIEVNQIGTGGDENLADGFFGNNVVWMIGSSVGEYRVETNGGVKVLRRSQTNSGAGFLLGYSNTGAPLEVFSVNDDEDLSDETLQVAMLFDNDLIAAGSTTGVLTDDPEVETNTLQDPALFRRNRQLRFEEDEDDNPDNDDDENKTVIVEPSQEWNQQLPVADPNTGSIDYLANYRDDEINALVRANDVWVLRLFTAEGRLLNPDSN